MTRTVLAIDTSTPAIVTGVLRRHDNGETEVLAGRTVVDSRAHAELLTPNIVAAVSDSDMTMDGLDAVVVGCGPGPFTGLRIGMATAAAYGHALGVPVYGVCSLDAMGVLTVGEVLVVTDARRREVYWARYRDGVRIAGPGVGTPAEAPVDAVERVAGAPAQGGFFDLPRVGPEHPSPAGLLAAVAEWGPPGPLVPLYLRRPDAKSLAERAGAAR